MLTICTHCNGKFEVDESAIGREATCPDCEERFVVRDAADVEMEQHKDAQQTQEVPKSPSVPFSNSNSSNNNQRMKENPTGIKSLYSSTSNIISCPDCGEKVSKRAPYCPHCGTPVRPSLSFSGINVLALILIIAAIGIAVKTYNENTHLLNDVAKSAMHEIFFQTRMNSGYLVALLLAVIASAIRLEK